MSRLLWRGRHVTDSDVTIGMICDLPEYINLEPSQCQQACLSYMKYVPIF